MKYKDILLVDQLYHSAVGSEFLKLRRTKITWVTFMAAGFMVAVSGFFMWMMKNPGLAERLGLLGQKANLVVRGRGADWTTFLDLVQEMNAIGSLLLTSVIAAFIFGREYSEGTAKNILALPVPRPAFVIAKLLVAAVWDAALTAWGITLTYAAGSLIDMPGFSSQLFLVAARRISLASLMAFSTSSLVAWISVRTRGYLAPLGYAIFTLLLAVTFGATEWGRWVPWSILLWYTGASGPGRTIGLLSYLILAGTFAIGTAMTIRHETHADNAQ